MFVRLAFAVTVCVDPDILIVDEALSVGDMAFQQKCLDRLSTLSDKGVTILLVTHDIMLIRNYCENVVYLQNGNVAMVADAETAGEAYVRDTKVEIYKTAASTKKVVEQGRTVRYGIGEGEVTAVVVEDAVNGLPVCTEGDLFIIRVLARIEKSVKAPAIHVQIRDFRGYILYGIFTEPTELYQREQGGHIVLRATLSMRAILQPGEYSVTVSLNNAICLPQIVLDKYVAAATFRVLPSERGRAFHGVVNLNGVWEKFTETVTVSDITTQIGD
jgi:lipopolysaccharide transport system ATP-binding protein